MRKGRKVSDFSAQESPKKCLTVLAVTAPFSCLTHVLLNEQKVDKGILQFFFGFSGEVSGDDLHGKPEGLVILSSPEVVQVSNKDAGSKIQDREINLFLNKFGQNLTSSHPTTFPGSRIRAKIEEILQQDFNQLRQAGLYKGDFPLYWVEVDINRFDDVFIKMYILLNCLRRRNKIGKEVWINFTGGSNPVNLGMMVASNLFTGIGRKYYFSVMQGALQQHARYWQSLMTQNDLDTFKKIWIDLPILHSRFTNFIEFVKALKEQHDQFCQKHSQQSPCMCPMDFIKIAHEQVTGEKLDTYNYRILVNQLRGMMLIDFDVSSEKFRITDHLQLLARLADEIERNTKGKQKIEDLAQSEEHDWIELVLI